MVIMASEGAFVGHETIELIDGSASRRRCRLPPPRRAAPAATRMEESSRGAVSHSLGETFVRCRSIREARYINEILTFIDHGYCFAPFVWKVCRRLRVCPPDVRQERFGGTNWTLRNREREKLCYCSVLLLTRGSRIPSNTRATDRPTGRVGGQSTC